MKFQAKLLMSLLFIGFLGNGLLFIHSKPELAQTLAILAVAAGIGLACLELSDISESLYSIATAKTKNTSDDN